MTMEVDIASQTFHHLAELALTSSLKFCRQSCRTAAAAQAAWNYIASITSTFEPR